MRRRGIFLVSVLFMALTAMMFLGAAVMLSPAQAFQARGELERGLARQAAHSGVEYALIRLRKDPTWRGNGNGVVVRRPDLIVIEDHGNVVGLQRQGDGQEFAQFRIRFNYQNGTDDPAELTFYDFNEVSLNNLAVGSDRWAPRIPAGSYSVPTNPAPRHLVPSRSVWLCVEGRSGAGLRDLSETNPNPAPGMGTVSRVVVRTGCKPTSTSIPSEDAVAMANSGIGAVLPTGTGNLTLSSAQAGTPARLRSNTGISVSNGAATNLVSSDAEAHYLSTFNANTSNVTAVQDNTPASFYQLSFNDLRKPPDTSGALPAGTYVVWQDGSLHYYDMSFSQYKSHMADPANAADAGTTPVDLPAGMQLKPSGTGYELVISDDVRVTTAANTSELSVIPRSGAPEKNGDVTASGVDPTDFSEKLLAHTELVGSEASTAFMFTDPNLSTVWTAVNGWVWNQPGHQVGNMVASDPVHLVMSSINFDRSGAQYQVNNSPGWAATSGYMAASIVQWAAATNSYTDPAFVSLVQAMGTTISPNGGVPGYLPNNGGDTLTAANLSVTFAPTNPQGFAVLAGAGDVRLGTGVTGQGGSITSAGNIKIVGMGVDLAANPNAREGVSLYACGNILINTFQATSKTGNQLEGVYRDLNLKGMVYAWNDFAAELGDQGQCHLHGCLVAYGGDPSLGDPDPANGRGRISLTAANASLRFDPSYLQDLLPALPANSAVARFYWDEQ